MIFVAKYSIGDVERPTTLEVDWIIDDMEINEGSKIYEAIMKNNKLKLSLSASFHASFNKRISISSEFDIYLTGKYSFGNGPNTCMIVITGKSVEPLLPLVKEEIDKALVQEKKNAESIKSKIEEFQNLQEKLNQRLNLSQTKSDPPQPIVLEYSKGKAK